MVAFRVTKLSLGEKYCKLKEPWAFNLTKKEKHSWWLHLSGATAGLIRSSKELNFSYSVMSHSCRAAAREPRSLFDSDNNSMLKSIWKKEKRRE